MHEMHEIEDARVVLGRLDAYVVQRGGVAEEILGGVGVGVEHVAGAFTSFDCSVRPAKR